jgi:hypothetical protein
MYPPKRAHGKTKRVLACIIQVVKEQVLPGQLEGLQTNANTSETLS